MKTCNDSFDSYGLSKAALHKYTEISAKENPELMISAVDPGIIDTGMTMDMCVKLKPEDGIYAIIYTLFNEFLPESGLYYGSDGKRSPLHTLRWKGSPPFRGYGD